jgi:DNA-binding CsgD family transcriptional regulator
VRYADFPADSLDASSQAAFAAHMHEHPLVTYYLGTGDGRPAQISDFLSQARFHELDLYQDFFRTIPVEHQIAVTVAEPDSTVVAIALNRARHDFTESDRDVLAIVRSPLASALRRIRLREASTEATAGLTAREGQIMNLVGTGHTNVAIARVLGTSPRTIAKHLEHIYGKLNVTSRAAAVSRIRPPDATISRTAARQLRSKPSDSVVVGGPGTRRKVTHLRTDPLFSPARGCGPAGRAAARSGVASRRRRHDPCSFRVTGRLPVQRQDHRFSAMRLISSRVAQ